MLICGVWGLLLQIPSVDTIVMVTMYSFRSMDTVHVSSDISWWKCTYLNIQIIGPLLDDRLKETLKNPETLKGCPLCSLSCLSVCVRATEHTFWPRNLIFGLKDPWDMRKKRNFLFFEILKNGIFRGHFHFPVCLSPSYRAHLLA